uniref:Uncharacterized protein n=1 Tax=Oryza sativa subsp. japonica TaxID=39947 RepID=Q9FRE2_ORYSJ|nr:hypothetical protein [Oryza sativa Japonica Group]
MARVQQQQQQQHYATFNNNQINRRTPYAPALSIGTGCRWPADGYRG